MGNRIADCIQTYTGKDFYILDPRPEAICIEDIAHALSLKCRFAGHCKWLYTVGQHSLLVSQIMEQRQGPEAGLVGLMHDSAEAYVGDVARPIKRMACMDEFRRAEDNILRVIFEKYAILNLDYKWADNTALFTEKRDLMFSVKINWIEEVEPLPQPIEKMQVEDVEQAFLLRFEELTHAIDRVAH